jgi:hypothetical protein
MSKTFKATWLGDDDPSAQMIFLDGVRFIKGEASDVPEDHAMADAIRGNPMFAVGSDKADVTPAKEPSADEQRAAGEAGTERGSLREQLARLGVTVGGNTSEATMRAKLAEATKGHTAPTDAPRY